jgi:hypothetical protein
MKTSPSSPARRKARPSLKTLRTREFRLQVDRHGNAHEIRPVLDRVRARMETIGAIADEQAVHEQNLTEFFDSRARGSVVIHDELLKTKTVLGAGAAPAAFRARPSWVKRGDAIEWRLDIEAVRGPGRELTVECVLPQPVYPGPMGSGHAKWRLWASVEGAPFEASYGMRHFEHCQCVDQQTDLPLPLFTLFDNRKDSDIGLSLLLPPDQVWYTDFIFNQRDWLMTARFKHLALPPGGKIRLKLWLFSHRGDYRAALGWLRKQFPVFFAPVPGQEKVDGNMAYTIPLIPEKRVADWATHMNYKWNELFHARSFGNYVPKEPFDSDHFATPEHPEWGVYGVTYDRLNEYIEMCHRHGVNVMPYLNIGECESTIAERDYPDSIALTTTGERKIPWVYYDKKAYTILMNCDPSCSWHKAVIEQYRELHRKLPEIDGFWFDQMGYGWIDTAHFDGFTYYRNRPAYNLAHMYLRTLKVLRRHFPRPRFNGMGNSPVRWQMMEFLDGAMSEGSAEFMDRMAPLCPERPTVLLAEGEVAFQNALYYGANLHVSPYYRYPTTAALPRDALRLFHAYHPLLEFLAGRHWVYDPNPLDVYWPLPNPYLGFTDRKDGRIRSNIFRTPDNDLVVTLTAFSGGLMHPRRRISNVEVRVRVRDGARLKTAVMFGADSKGYDVRPVEPMPDGSLRVVLPSHGVASMVVLTGDMERLQGRKDWLKFREPRRS